MAAFALTDASLTVNSVDLSAWTRSLELTENGVPLDTTAMGDTYNTFEVGGLKNWAINAELIMDYAASATYATLQPLINTTTTCVVKPTSGSVSTTNPSFTGSGFLEGLPFVSGSVGDLAVARVTFRGSGTLTIATS